MQRQFLLVAFLGIFFLNTPLSLAEIPEENRSAILTFRFGFQTFTLPLKKYPEFLTPEPPITEKDFCEWHSTTEPSSAPLKKEKISEEVSLNTKLFRDFVLEFIAPKIEREAESVRIFRGEEGKIAFEGAGVNGFKIDFDRLTDLTEFALEKGVFDIRIPVLETPPQIQIDDPELKKMGITELLAVGESDFSRSSWDRMHNIESGKNRFNGVLIPKGEVFSFNENLGAVDKAHGYLPELVIVGPKLSKEYGGGLCQVSSTTFRAALMSGLPIVERHNHSFAVHYYEPWGTDATIYLGGKDLKFKNDTPGAILIQTVMDRANRILRFHFYGTRDGRVTRFFGPFISNRVGALPSKVETSEKLAPGETLALSHAVAGFDAEWTRLVIPSKDFSPSQAVYSFLSHYQPRAEWTLVGAENPVLSEETLPEAKIVHQNDQKE